jgi:hypothetical protein
MPSAVHESFPSYFATEMYPEIRTWISKKLPNFRTRFSLSVRKKLLSGVPPITISKEPDAGIHVWGPSMGEFGSGYPSLVVEVGYGEGWPKLKRDSYGWLSGSSRKVRTVILVKFHKPKANFGDATKWRGYLEIQRLSKYFDSCFSF